MAGQNRGRNLTFLIHSENITNHGGAIKGWMPRGDYLTDKQFTSFTHVRQQLKQSWNNNYPSQLMNSLSLKSPMITPFRAINNAGDLLDRKNYMCGPNGSSCAPSVINNALQINNDIPAAATNVKFVYDSSDYVTYLKQRAINKNYHSYSNGGNNSNSNQSVLRNLRI